MSRNISRGHAAFTASVLLLCIAALPACARRIVPELRDEAQKLVNDARQPALRNDDAAMAAHLARAAQYFLESGAGEDGVRAFRFLGVHFANSGRTRHALYALDQALSLARRSGSARAEYEVLGLLARVHRDQGDLDTAIKLHEEQLSVLRGAGWFIERGWNPDTRSNYGYVPAAPLIDLAWAHYRAGNLSPALQSCQGAANGTVRNDSTGFLRWHMRAEINFTCGMIETALGHYPAALANLTEALKIWTERRDAEPAGVAHMGLAAWHRTTGNLHQAREHISKALLFVRRDSSRRLGRASNVKGDVWGSQFARVLLEAGLTDLLLNRLSDAERHYVRALDEAATRPDHVRERAEALRGLARIAARRGDTDKGLAYLRQAVEAVEPTGFEGVQAAVLIDLGTAYLDHGDVTAATAPLERAHRLHTAARRRVDLLYSTGALARLAMARGDLTTAHQHVRYLDTTLREIGLFSDGWRFLLTIAEFHEREGRLEDAFRTLQEAAKQIEGLRTRLPSEDLRAVFVEDKQIVYEELARLARRLGRPAEAFDAIERSKGRAFLDLLTQRAAAPTRKPQGASEEEYLRLDQTAHQLEAEIATLQTRAAERPLLSASVEQKTRQLRDAVDERDRTARQLVQTNSRLLQVSARPVPLPDLQAKLPESTVVLNYFLGKRLALVAVADRQGVEVVELPGVREPDILALAKLLSDPDSHGWAQPAREMYDRLLRPVLPLLGAKRQIIIVPHRALHYLPLHALPGPDGRFLLQDFAVSYLPSASVLRQLPKGPGGRKGVLAIANPDVPGLASLPGAEAEVRGISALLPARLLARGQATKPSVTAEAGRHPVLHFATHGELDAKRPMASSLRLTPTKEDDGRLTVDEIYNLELAADLVVLSACATGLTAALNGEAVSPGDEVVGFSRGFLYAGARSLVATLWPVDDDATAAIVVEFYRNLGAMPKAEALRRAQLAILNDQATAAASGRARGVQAVPRGGGGVVHPFYWAAFLLVGDGE